MSKIIGTTVAIVLIYSLMAHMFSVKADELLTITPDRPDIKLSRGIVSAQGTVCNENKNIDALKLYIKKIAYEFWEKDYKKDRKYLAEIKGWLKASTIIVIPRHKYMMLSTPQSTFCTAVVLLNGMRVEAAGYTGRNVIRYMTFTGGLYVIDYDLNPMGPIWYPDPQKQSKS